MEIHYVEVKDNKYIFIQQKLLSKITLAIHFNTLLMSHQDNFLRDLKHTLIGIIRCGIDTDTEKIIRMKILITPEIIILVNSF